MRYAEGMGAKIYLETSVVSYYAARPSRDVVIAGHQQATRDFWDRLGHDFEPFISAVVLAEAGQGDSRQAEKRLQAVRSFPVFRITREAEVLSHELTAGGGIPPEYPEDALHVALAAIGGVEFLERVLKISPPSVRDVWTLGQSWRCK
jgi:predicted nucleic acid-binding protein